MVTIKDARGFVYFYLEQPVLSFFGSAYSLSLYLSCEGCSSVSGGTFHKGDLRYVKGAKKLFQ